MIDYVGVYDNVLPVKLCNDIINKFEKHPEQHESTVLSGHRSFTEINITKNVDTWLSVQDTLMDTAQDYLGRYMAQFGIVFMVLTLKAN